MYKIQWKGIFSFLEIGIKLSVSDADSFTLRKTTEVYEQFVSCLKTNFESCFEKKGSPMNWIISTWSLRTRKISVLKYGSKRDKVNISNEFNGRKLLHGKIS